ncbi:hypothetical protein C4573_01760 [Candidatus Woesearchaeota archaeon]|nr:MAG: hypothetical protein C4573_01760 [Candidatus Woesearchaeota archaeon]
MDIPDLKTLKMPLEKALSAYEATTGMKFQDFPDLTLTPDKPNSARTIIPVTYGTAKVGELYAIVFAKGDGTGDSKSYQLENLLIPEEFRHAEKPERVIPRAKTGVIAEGCFPFFSLTPEGYTAMFAASLDELGIQDNAIVPLWKLGLNDADYAKALRDERRVHPQIYLTVGDSLQGTPIGDPHAVYYNRSTEDALQVVGFLGITDKKSPILHVSKQWIRHA